MRCVTGAVKHVVMWLIVSNTCMKLLCLEAVFLLHTQYSVMQALKHKVFVYLVLLRCDSTHLKLVQECHCLWKQVEGVNKGNSNCSIFQIVKLGEEFQNDYIPGNECTREYGTLRILNASLESLQSLPLHHCTVRKGASCM